MKIVLTRRWPHAVMAALEETYELVAPEGNDPLEGDALLAAIPDAEVFCPSAFDAVPDSLIQALPDSVRLIANYGVGTNNIDVGAAIAKGLLVSNTPDVLTDDTADIAFGLMLAAARRFQAEETLLREGRWAGSGPLGSRSTDGEFQPLGLHVSGATLGIIGMGRIGKAVAKRAQGFNMRVLYHCRSRKKDVEDEYGAIWCENRNEVLFDADFVSLHCALADETHHLIDAEALREMKSTAVLVNTGRGPLVDETALVEALRSNEIAAAGLDVYEREPELAEGLAELSNVTLLPHIGSGTLATRSAMGMRVKKNIDCFRATGRICDTVTQ